MNIEMKTAPLINNVQSPTESEKIYSEGFCFYLKIAYFII